MKAKRLLEKSVVSTYAQALFEASREADHALSNVSALEQTADTIRSHHDLHDALCGQELPGEHKHALIQELLSEHYPAELVSVVAVMAERGDIDLIGRVAAAYKELVETDLNVVITEVTTAVELDDHLRQLITDKIASMTGKQAYLEEQVDPSILGGIILTAQGKRMDASISAQLLHARAALSKPVSIGGEA